MVQPSIDSILFYEESAPDEVSQLLTYELIYAFAYSVVAVNKDVK